MSSKTTVKPPKISRRVKIVTISGITVMCALIFTVIVAYCYNYYPDQIVRDIEFTMREGDRRAVRESNDLVIELSRIEDARCPSDGYVMCFWEGEIRYFFQVDGKEIVLGTVTDLKDGEKIRDYTIRYISGDEKQGVFVLQKDEK